MPPRLVSYSRDLEDVRLKRALQHVEHGFYIDIGATGSSIESNTRMLYNQGWSGLNVAYTADSVEALRLERDRDVTVRLRLPLPAGGREISASGSYSNSPMNSVQALEAESDGENGFEIQSLARILDENIHRDVHLLAIRLEGVEADLVKQVDLQRWHPWAVVLTTDYDWSAVNKAQMAQLLGAARYVLVQSEKTSAMFVSQELHANLGPAISAALTADCYIRDHGTAEVARLRAEVERVSIELDECQQEVFEGSRALLVGSRDLNNINLRLKSANAELRKLRKDNRLQTRAIRKREEELQALRRQFSSIRESSSWRLTRPLRALSRARHLRPTRNARG